MHVMSQLKASRVHESLCNIQTIAIREQILFQIESKKELS